MSSQVTHISAMKFSVNESSAKRNVGLVIIISLAFVVPALLYGIPANKDLLNHFRFAQPFYDSLRMGHLYPSWLAESNSGYGDPSFRFYPPALYYLLSMARAVTGNWYVAMLLTLTLLSTLGGLGVYFWARSALSSSAAMWAAVLYALAPYHFNQLYQAFLLAEFAGAAALPFAFAFVERVCRRGRYRDVAGLAAAYAFLVLTHLPLAVIGSLSLAVYAFVRIDRRGWKKSVWQLALAAALGLAASSVYWVRMVTELGWIGINNVNPDHSVDYDHNFVFATLSSDNLNVWWMNIITVITFLLFVPALVLLARRARARIEFIKLRPVVVLGAAALFMSLPLSWPLWKLLPGLQQVQFPWRWLAVFSMAGSVVTGAAVPIWLHNKMQWRRTTRLVIFGCVLMSVAFTLSHIVREAEYRSRSQFESDLRTLRGTPSVNYWIPIWAKPHPRPMTSEVEAGPRAVAVNNWSPEHRQFAVSRGDAIEARVRTFYYPHWTATSSGRVLPTRPDADGALLVSLPGNAEVTSVSLDFREPPRARIAAGVCAIAWLLIGVLALASFKRGSEQRSGFIE